MDKRPRIKDIAERLGLSSTLVSLVVNNKADQYGIRRETREKVLYAAREMGYFGAQNTIPVREKPGVVGLITHDLQDPFLHELIPCMQKAFQRVGLGFSVMEMDTDPFRYRRLLDSYISFFSALIFAGPVLKEERQRELKKRHYPFLCLEAKNHGLKVNRINTHYDAESSLIISHLYNLGYRKLALVIPGSDAGSIIRFRADSFNAEIGKNSMIRNVGVLELNIRNKASGELKEKLLSLLKPPVSLHAMVLANARMVFPFMEILRSLKLRVPGDLAVVCFDNHPAFEHMHPTITALKRPVMDMALSSAEILWKEIKSNGRNRNKEEILLEPELNIRRSCGSIP